MQQRIALAALTLSALALASCGGNDATQDESIRDEAGEVVEGGEVGASVVEQAEAGCVAEFDAFIGLPYTESAADITAVFPSEATWNGIDDREVLCGVFPISDEDTAGSGKGIAE